MLRSRSIHISVYKTESIFVPRGKNYLDLEILLNLRLSSLKSFPIKEFDSFSNDRLLFQDHESDLIDEKLKVHRNILMIPISRIPYLEFSPIRVISPSKIIEYE